MLCIQNMVKFILKLLIGNKILTSIKGCNSVKILQKMAGHNPKLDLVNVDVHTIFGQILSIPSQDVEWNIRILHDCQVWIDKFVPRVKFWHHEARRVMPNCDPRDRFVYPYLTHMMDSFSCTP